MRRGNHSKDFRWCLTFAESIILIETCSRDTAPVCLHRLVRYGGSNLGLLEFSTENDQKIPRSDICFGNLRRALRESAGQHSIYCAIYPDYIFDMLNLAYSRHR